MAREATVEIAYVPFKTFLTALDTLRQGIPDPVDRTVFRSQSGSTQAVLLSSLRALGCLDQEGHPQPILRELVDPTTRKTALNKVLEEKYHEVLALGDAATDKQFDDCFVNYGVAGETRKKAKSFFLQAAHTTGIALSPHVSGARIVSGEDGEAKPAAPRRRRSRKRDKTEYSSLDKNGSPPSSRGSTKTIPLASGGEVTLSVTIDPMELTDEDQEWVFGLIKQLRAYEKSGGPPSRTVASGAAES